MSKNYGKKKIIRNVLIGVLAAVVLAAAIFLSVTLQKDSAGMNYFQRNKTALTADGERVSFVEYRLSFDALTSSYQSKSLTDEQIKNLQDYAVQQAMLQKVTIKEAKALGLTLTDEQLAKCRETADQQIDSIEQYYAKSLIERGNYSKSLLDSQLASYYQNLGMNKETYRAFLTEAAEAEYYEAALDSYYKENRSGVLEEDLVAYYRGEVEKTMLTKNEDGTETVNYVDGQYWNTFLMYLYGYSTPMLYIPEGFIYIDYIRLEAASVEEAEELVRKVAEGETDFDSLMDSDDNKDMYRLYLKAPYPIAENDHSLLFDEQEVYTLAEALKIGEIGSYIVKPEAAEDAATETAEEGTTETEEKQTTVTVYLFRRAEGTMCYDGDHGIIKMDYYDGVRDSVEEQYRIDQWLSDLKVEDAVYAYKGALG